MKKHYLILIAGILSLSVINVAAQKKTTSTKRTASAPLTKANANKIIAMTNVVVDIYNDQLSDIKRFRESIDSYERAMEDVSKNPKSSAYGASCANIVTLRKDYVEDLQANAKLAPAFAEKAEILKGVEDINKELELAKEQCQNLSKYFSEKRYLKDVDNKYSDYIALRDTFIASYSKVNELFGKTMNLSSAAGDRAELVILKSHPMASVIIPMKKNLSAVSQLMAKCREEKPDAEAIKTDMAAIRKSLEKDKVMTATVKTALKKSHNGEDKFNRFYEYVGEAMNKTDIFVEYLDPNKEVDVDHILEETVEDARARHLGRHYDEVRKYYRYMVDEYNNI